LIEDSQTLHTSYLHYPVSSWFGDVRGDVLTFILSHSHCENVRAFFYMALFLNDTSMPAEKYGMSTCSLKKVLKTLVIHCCSVVV
jgi:hypothetical protein